MGYRICSTCQKRYNELEECSCKKNNRNDYSKEYYQKNKEQMKILTSTRWRRLRLKIIQRDNGCCQRCLNKFGIINGSELQVHHIKPRSVYPELIYDESNLITMCKLCNVELGTREELDFEIEAKKEIEINL
ncbi:MAG: HNH endonuclease [Clostridium sp.]